ncbi:MAG: sulfatase [Verrucomicrobia bacterium]|nr:sulfatase [Verrucomicrobiota bacterium]
MWLVRLFILLVSMGIFRSPATATAAQRPNLVIFLADDHGYWDSQLYGATDVRTPNMLRLASAGMAFTLAFVASPSCAPSRTAMLTGLMPARNGAEANHTFKREGIRSLTENLKDLGYEVAAFGKVAHGADARRHGFDKFDKRHDAAVVEKFLAGRDPAKALCLFVGTPEPHVPWAENRTYDPGKVSLPPTHPDTPETRAQRTRYYTDITQMDTELGAIYDLTRSRLGTNILFIYTSDNGAQWPFGKWNLYDAGIRTPLIAVWPGTVKPASKTGAMVSWVDLLPTLIEAAGGRAPSDIDGRSFLGVLRGTTGTHRDEIFATHSGDGNKNIYPIRALRTAEFKYILNLFPGNAHTTHIDRGGGSGDGWRFYNEWSAAAKTNAFAAGRVRRYHQRPREELYRVTADPFETNNLAADPQHDAVLAELRARLEAWMNSQGDTRKNFNEPIPLTPEGRPAVAP